MLVYILKKFKKIDRIKKDYIISKKFNNFISIYIKKLNDQYKDGKLNETIIKNNKINQIIQGFFNINKKFNLVAGSKNIIKNYIIDNFKHKFYSNNILKNSKLLLVDINKLIIGTKNKLELEIKLIFILNIILKIYRKNIFLILENIDQILLDKENKIIENFENIINIFKFCNNIRYFFTIDYNKYKIKLKEFNDYSNIFRIIEITDKDININLKYLNTNIKIFALIFEIIIDDNCYNEINYFSNKLYPKLNKLEATIEFLNELISYLIYNDRD